MLPEVLVIAFVVFPVHGHVGQEVGGAKGFENVADVGVGAAVVAIGFVAAVAAVGPVSVQSVLESDARESRAMDEMEENWARIERDARCKRIEELYSPKTVDCPGIIGAGGRVGVPELRLQHLATGVVEATQILDD